MGNSMYDVNIKLFGNDHAHNSDMETLQQVIENFAREAIIAMNEKGNMIILTPADVSIVKVDDDDEDN